MYKFDKDIQCYESFCYLWMFCNKLVIYYLLSLNVLQLTGDLLFVISECFAINWW